LAKERLIAVAPRSGGHAASEGGRCAPFLNTPAAVSLFGRERTASELNHLFGEGELGRVLFTHRPSELQLNRRQRIRELVHLSKLADAHSVAEFRNPASAAHNQLIDIVRRLARDPRARSSTE
jgi:hypothetical protein